MTIHVLIIFVPSIMFNTSSLTLKPVSQLHVYAMLRQTEPEHELPYISILVPYDGPTVSRLDDIARNMVAPQYHSSRSDGEGDGRPV